MAMERKLMPVEISGARLLERIKLEDGIVMEAEQRGMNEDQYIERSERAIEKKYAARGGRNSSRAGKK